MRTYAAEGATVITDEHNKDYFQKVVLGPQSRTLEPDRCAVRQWPAMVGLVPQSSPIRTTAASRHKVIMNQTRIFVAAPLT